MSLQVLALLREYRRRWQLVAAILFVVAALGGSGLLTWVVIRPALGTLSYPDAAHVWAVFQRGADGRPATRLDENAVGEWLALPGKPAWARPLGSATARIGGDEVGVSVAVASADLLPMLGVVPLLGGAFDQSTPTPALLSYAIWVRHFGRAASVVGMPIHTTLGTVTLVGVLPEGFLLPWIGFDQPDVLTLSNEAPTEGVLAWIARKGQDRGPGTAQVGTLTLMPLREYLLGGFAETSRTAATALTLFGAQMVAALLMLFASLHDARYADKAVHAALGRPWHRSIATSALELCFIGGFGMLLAIPAGQFAIRAAKSGPVLREMVRREMVLDGFGILIATTVTLVLAALAYGAITWRRESKPAGSAVLARSRSLGVMTTAQVAIAATLGVATMATAMSVRTSLSRDVGFNPTGLYVADLAGPTTLQTNSDRHTYFLGVERHLVDIFGRDSVAAIDSLALAGALPQRLLLTDAELKGDERGALWQVTPGYFRVMGMELVAGRAFSDAEMESGAEVCLLTQRAAARLMGTPAPVGQELEVSAGLRCQVIGVVGESADAVRGSRWWGAYVPFTRERFRRMTLVIRSNQSREQVETSTVPAFKIGNEQPRVRVAPAVAFLANRAGDLGFLAPILSGLAMVVLCVAVIGMYGIITAQVVRQSPFYALQLALGASASHVFANTIRQIGWPLIRGAALGVTGGWLYQRHLAASFEHLVPVESWMLWSTLAGATVVAILGCRVLASVVFRRHGAGVMSQLHRGR